MSTSAKRRLDRNGYTEGYLEYKSRPRLTPAFVTGYRNLRHLLQQANTKKEEESVTEERKERIRENHLHVRALVSQRVEKRKKAKEKTPKMTREEELAKAREKRALLGWKKRAPHFPTTSVCREANQLEEIYVRRHKKLRGVRAAVQSKVTWAVTRLAEKLKTEEQDVG